MTAAERREERRRTIAERMAIHDKRERAIKLAGTYVKKARDWLYWDEQRPVSVSYWSMVETLLEAADDILEALPDDYFDNVDVDDFFGLGGGGRIRMSDRPQELAEKVVATIASRRADGKRRERIAKLENVDGRNEIEAAALRAKAAELRGGVS